MEYWECLCAVLAGLWIHSIYILYICIFVYLYICVYVYLCIYMYICVYLYICIFVDDDITN